MQLSAGNAEPGRHSAAVKPSVTSNFMDSVESAGANAHPSWVEERARVAVNRNVRVSGRLVFQEPIRIDGHFRGEVSSSELVVISEDASVGGRIRSPRLVVLGELEGDITASKSVLLGPRSRFKGKLEADNITICEGAYLNADLRIGCRSKDRRA